jgi:hypothetical protein
MVFDGAGALRTARRGTLDVASGVPARARDMVVLAIAAEVLLLS